MPCDDEKWYEHEVKAGKLPDKNGYYHYPPKEYYEILADELEQDENDEW
jgi:hypothetical protein